MAKSKVEKRIEALQGRLNSVRAKNAKLRAGQLAEVQMRLDDICKQLRDIREENRLTEEYKVKLENQILAAGLNLPDEVCDTLLGGVSQ